MNKRNFLSALLGTLLLAGLIFAGSALAAPAKQKVAFQYLKSQTVTPGKVWVDGDGMHIRGRVDSGFVSGDINGMALVVYNADMPLYSTQDQKVPTPDDGQAYGTIQIFETNLELIPPTWEGKWAYQVLDGAVVSGTLTAMNPYTMQLIKIRRVFSNSLGGISHVGIIEYLTCRDLKCPPIQ